MKVRCFIRLASLTLLLALIVFAADVLASDCGGSHTWDAGVIVWNEDYTAAEGVWTCSVCGDTHTEQADVTSSRLSESTCQSAGRENLLAEAVFDNIRCISTKKIELPQLEHVYAEPTFHWNTVDFSCEAIWICTIGDETEREECKVTKSTYPAVGHTPGGTIYVAYIEVGGETYIDTRKVEGDPIGHDYCDPVFYWSDDYTAARVESVCSICEVNDPERIIGAECTINLREKKADCFSDGLGTYIARADLLGQVWEDTKTVIYSRLQHVYPEPSFLWENGDCTVVSECERCETPYPDACVISTQKTYQDCTSPGKLIRTAKITVEGIGYSDSEEEEIPAKGHAQIRLAGKEPTCSEVGMTDGIGCSACNAVLLTQTEIPALGHADAAIEGVNATCTEAGWTDRIFCTVCDEVLEESTVIPAKGHTAKVIPGYAPTCTEEGRGDGEICTVCQEMLKEQIILPATGHTSLILDAREATCTEDGYSAGEICSVCKATLVKQTIFHAKGHTKETRKGYAATCTEEGLTDGTCCSVCQEVLQEQSVIPANGHAPQTLASREATCTESGLTEGEICAVCQTVLKKQSVIPPKGHTPEKEDPRPATCTEPGYTEGNTCLVCREVFLKPGVIPPKGHTSQPLEGQAASCTEDGITSGRICSVCQLILEEQTVIPATGHRPMDMETQDATCTAEGFTGGRICSVCQSVLEEPIPIPAAGHQWNPPVFTWNETKDPVLAEKTCSTCKTVLTGEISVNRTEIAENGKTVALITATVIFSDGTTASDEKRMILDSLPSAPELPEPEPVPSPEPEPDVPLFDDVAVGCYYYDAVAWAAKTQITQGTACRIFSPDMICSRAQIVTMLWRAAGSPLMEGTTVFSDVPRSAYYYQAVLWASERGITAGTSQNTFSPDLQCTRAQIVTMLWRAAGCPATAEIASFDDVAADVWYAGAVTWAVDCGITLGTGEGTFSPDAVCTRSQIVTFMYRARTAR